LLLIALKQVDSGGALPYTLFQIKSFKS